MSKDNEKVLLGHKSNSFISYKYAPYIPVPGFCFSLPIEFVGYDSNGKAVFKKIKNGQTT